jgi:hypothetical protein
MFYTGVGARATPVNILNLMTRIAIKLNGAGFWLRSGGAIGADTAFELGAVDKKQIFYARQATVQAMQIAANFHPAWNRCSPFAKKLHGRNAFQVLGHDLNSPSQFLICWTPDGCITHASRSYTTGGTGTAISIASAHKIPVHNLAITQSFNDWTAWLL